MVELRYPVTTIVETCHNPSCMNMVRREQWQIRDGSAKYCSRQCIVYIEVKCWFVTYKEQEKIDYFRRYTRKTLVVVLQEELKND